MICPHCNGTKTGLGFGSLKREDCKHCKGKGVIVDAPVEEIKQPIEADKTKK